MAWHEKYLSIPFECNKFDFTSCDCGGLVLLVLEQERGIILPRIDSCVKFTAKQKHEAICAYNKYIVSIDKKDIEPFDVFTQISADHVYHCGIFIDRDRILHSTIDRGVRIEPSKLLMSNAKYYRVMQ